MVAVRRLRGTERIISKVAHPCSFGKRPQFLTTCSTPHRQPEYSYDMAPNSPKVGSEKRSGRRGGRWRGKEMAVLFMSSHNKLYTITSTLKKVLEPSYSIQSTLKSKEIQFHFLKECQKFVDTFSITTYRCNGE